MKKGFFLFEALFACVLISFLVGTFLQHHAQWFRSHKKSLDRSKALAHLMAHIEQSEKPSNLPLEGYKITLKKISVPAPTSSDGQHYAPAQCTELIISWDDSIAGSSQIGIVLGDYHEG